MRLILTLLTALLLSPLCAAETPVLLENDQVSLEIEPVFGRFSRILDKQSRIELASVAGPGRKLPSGTGPAGEKDGDDPGHGTRS